MKRGRLIVISAPSGAGKTSLVKKLLEDDPQLQLSISHTTRKRRPTEAEGREYHFVPVAKFRELEARGEFLEHARVFDNYYGTSRAFVAGAAARRARRGARDRLAGGPAGARAPAAVPERIRPATLAAGAARAPRAAGDRYRRRS